MMSSELIFRCKDNSGVMYAKFLNVYKIHKNKTIKRGCIVTVFPHKFTNSKQIKRKKFLAVVTNLKNRIRRFNGIYFKGFINKILMLSDSYKFLGTRVYGPLCREVRGGKREVMFKRIISYSSGTI